jgi:hypothetical protein
MSQDSDLIVKVRQTLETYARSGRLARYKDIEERVGRKIRQTQWRQILDPIYEDCVAQGKPDLTAIVVYGDGLMANFPPYFNESQEARSKRSYPNNLRQV